MLISYINKYKKIVMGLLNYLDDFKEIKHLEDEMTRVEEGKRQLYLWQDTETSNIVGLIGLQIQDKKETIIVRYLSLSPSFRDTDIQFDMLSAIAKDYPHYTLCGTIEMSDLLKQWAIHEQRTIPFILEGNKDE